MNVAATNDGAMISDPKLPFASDAAPIGDLKSPVKTSAPFVQVSAELPREAPAKAPGGETAPVPPSRPPLSPAHLWLRRIGVLCFVFLCATIGVMLMILPWRPEWSDNPLLLSYPTLRNLLASGFARGLATGLGAINVWIGFWEAIQYREE
jgi:hypothetical protein